MTTHILRPNVRTWSLAGLCMMLFLFTACDSSNALMENEAPAVASGINTLADNLDLTGSQAEKINDVVAKHGENEPGTLWYVAAELQQTMTEDQKAALFAKIEEAREARKEAMGTSGEGQRQRGLKGRRIGQGATGLGVIEDLTDEQKEAMKALREAQREKVDALRTQRKNGELDEEAFKAALTTIREEAEAELSNILTDEQLEAMQAARDARQEAMGERKGRGLRGGAADRGKGNRSNQTGRFGAEAREASEAARKDALNLTDAQIEQIATLRAQQKEAGAELLESLRESGDWEAAREQLAAFKQESEAAMREILTADQQEMITIHRALAFSAAKQRTGDKAGRGANRRFKSSR